MFKQKLADRLDIKELNRKAAIYAKRIKEEQAKRLIKKNVINTQDKGWN